MANDQRKYNSSIFNPFKSDKFFFFKSFHWDVYLSNGIQFLFKTKDLFDNNNCHIDYVEYEKKVLKSNTHA